MSASWCKVLGVLVVLAGGFIAEPLAAKEPTTQSVKRSKVKKPRKGSTEPARTPSGGPVGTPEPRRPEPTTPAPSRPAEPSKGPEAARTPVDRPTPAASSPERRAPAIARPQAPEPPPREATHRPYDPSRAQPQRPPYETRDHRYAHPDPRHVRAYPDAGHPPPHHHWYRPWYTHWWVHPYYRWVHTTRVVVWFDFHVDPWVAAWVPPPRPGWVWISGHWEGPVWIPGHWEPTHPPATWYGARWVYVPGFWIGPVYVEGYWRVERRADGRWEWVDGHYTADGAYVPGHWVPADPAPAGYVWEPGFWNGEHWVEGYWRPASREGYVWVSARYTADGTYEAGYWEPAAPRPGYVWIPGWFDGEKWVPGYWVPEADYRSTDPQAWTPPAGAEDGWNEPAPSAPPTTATEGDEVPLALPVTGG